jgi:N6-L-threonylcarbamoyladenine synthase
VGWIIEEALSKAGLNGEDIDVFAYSIGPGMGQCLRVASIAAKALSMRFKKPLVGANHCVAHLEIGKFMNKFKDPLYVFASGGNTQLIALSFGRYRVFGETLDISVGNLLDALGRTLKIGFPGVPKIDKIAKKGKYIELPYLVKGTDLSYSGMLTKCKQLVGSKKPEDICFSVQETAFSMLVEVAERALAQTKKKEVVVIGGVANNSRLKEMLELMAKGQNAKLGYVSSDLTWDNGAMIAHLGLKMFKAGHKNKVEDKIMPKFRVDDMEVDWI